MFNLDVYSHYVVVRGFSKQGMEALFGFARRQAQIETLTRWNGKFYERHKVLKRVFAATRKDRLEFRFHINQLNELIEYLQGNVLRPEEVRVTRHSPPEAEEVEFRMRPEWTPRDYQIPVIDYMVEPTPTSVVKLQTGKGKTFSALKAMEILSKRTVLIVKGGYIDQWVKAYEKTFFAEPDDLMIVRGSKQLNLLLEQAIENELTSKFIIVSNKTKYNYIDDYETFNGAGMYIVPPDKFYETLRAGVSIKDEVHMDFHLNFKEDLYKNVEKSIELSATLTPDDPFMKRMYEIKFPLMMRYKGSKYDKYVNVKALHYSLDNPQAAKYRARGRGSYSHVEFEKYIMRNKRMMDRYVEMIARISNIEFVREREEGQKLLIFAATKKFCTILRDRLAMKYPNLKVRRYLDEDTYEDMLKGDIIVSTLLSSGTALDIPGLKVALMTTALGSSQLNEQALGRLRRLDKWPDVNPTFVYLVCDDIKQHLEYHQRKQELLKDKALSLQSLMLSDRI